MNGAIGHWGPQMEAVRALSSAGAAEHVPVRGASMLRRAGAVSVGFPMVALWLATTGMATATPAAPALRFLLPAPTHIRLASSGIVAIVDGARVAVRGADRAQVQPIVDRFIELLATTRGLQLQAASVADPHPAIIFEVDPRTSVAADGGYRIVSGARGVRVIARSPAGLFYGSVTLWQLLTPPGWISGTAAETHFSNGKLTVPERSGLGIEIDRGLVVRGTGHVRGDRDGLAAFRFDLLNHPVRARLV